MPGMYRRSRLAARGATHAFYNSTTDKQPGSRTEYSLAPIRDPTGLPVAPPVARRQGRGLIDLLDVAFCLIYTFLEPRSQAFS